MEELENLPTLPAEEAPAACGGDCALCPGCAGADAQEAPEVMPEEVPESVPETERRTVVDVRFRSGGKAYFFDPGELKLSAGEDVIIETSRGAEFGTCASGNHRVRACDIVAPLRPVLRRATRADQRIAAENREKEKRAFAVCQQKIREHGLEMQLVSAEAAFDGSKLLFFFTSEGRVDFRELVKNLASVFRTRIELRQIGVRDKAKMVGGLGICGRPFCCREFLDDFQPVSIKMAKTQNLSLNPTKISGTCGRLMCCLKYEQDAYEELLREAPKPESFVDTPDGRGTVMEVNLIRQTVRVRMEEQPDVIGTYRNDAICVLRSGKAKKNDPPIPKELAPISSKPREERADGGQKEPPALEALIYRSDPVPEPARPAQPAPEAQEERPQRGRRPRRKGEKPAPEQREAAGQRQKPSEPRDKREKPAEKREKPAEKRDKPTAQPDAEQRERPARKDGGEQRDRPARKDGGEQRDRPARKDGGEARDGAEQKKHRNYRRKKPKQPDTASD